MAYDEPGAPEPYRRPDAQNPFARKSALRKLALLRKMGYNPQQFGIGGDPTAQFRAMSPLLGMRRNIQAGVPGQYETPEGTNQGIAELIAKMRADAQVRNSMEGRQFPRMPGLGPEEGLGASMQEEGLNRAAQGGGRPVPPQFGGQLEGLRSILGGGNRAGRAAGQKVRRPFIGREQLPGGVAEKLAGASNRELLNAVAKARKVRGAVKHLRKLRPAPRVKVRRP